MIRTLISVPEVESLQWLGENCGVPDLGKVAGTMSVTVSDVTELTRKCMVYQGVLADAAEMHADAKRQEQQAQQDGSEDEAFKPLQWTVVHGAASFSDPAILDAALAVEPYIAAALEKKHTQHRSKGNQWQSADDRAAPQTTPMHIAAIRGNTRLIELLVKNGHPTNAADRWGRIPLEYACLQMWTPLELTAAFGASALEYCNEMGTLTLRRPGIGEDAHADVAANRNRSSVRDGGSGGSGGGGGGNPNQEYAPFEYVEAGGGFQTPTENAKIPSTCDFDIVTKMTVAEFQHTYVSARRPLLLRGFQKGPKWDALRESWSKAKIAASHPDVRLETASIPYAKTFGFVEPLQSLSIAEYVDQIMDADRDRGSDQEPPRYIFSSTKLSLPANSSLHAVLTTPSFAVDRDNIKDKGPQWYLGAPDTGAPIHYHDSALNVLVHGRKRWTLLPPRHALYSKKHILKWTVEDYPKVKDVALQCIQEPGDIVFVPEAWSHGVLNLAESVGWAFEFEVAYKKMRPFDRDRRRQQLEKALGSGGGVRADSSTSTDGTRAPTSKLALMQKRIKVLRQMLKEVGGECKGCTEREQFADAIVARVATYTETAAASKDEL